MTHNEKRQSAAREGFIGLGGLFHFLYLLLFIFSPINRLGSLTTSCIMN